MPGKKRTVAETLAAMTDSDDPEPDSPQGGSQGGGNIRQTSSSHAPGFTPRRVASAQTKSVSSANRNRKRSSNSSGAHPDTPGARPRGVTSPVISPWGLTPANDSTALSLAMTTNSPSPSPSSSPDTQVTSFGSPLPITRNSSPITPHSLSSPRSSSPSDSESDDDLGENASNKALLMSVIKRMDRHKKMLSKLQKSEQSSSKKMETRMRAKDVPLEVRVSLMHNGCNFGLSAVYLAVERNKACV